VPRVVATPLTKRLQQMTASGTRGTPQAGELRETGVITKVIKHLCIGLRDMKIVEGGCVIEHDLQRKLPWAEHVNVPSESAERLARESDQAPRAAADRARGK
jgi:hypothetical protein